MLESGLSGSVRGVPSNGHPYRDPASSSDVGGHKAVIGTCSGPCELSDPALYPSDRQRAARSGCSVLRGETS
jgi:hypothetical protein